MPGSLYQSDPGKAVHRGAVFEFRPVSWLDPPLWCIRNVRYGNPGSADLYEHSALLSAFRVKSEEHQEHVLARAKVRHVVVLSNDYVNSLPTLDKVAIVPSYSLQPHKPEFAERVRRGEFLGVFYLAEDPAFPEVGECFLDYGEVRPIHRGFLASGKLSVCLTSQAAKAVVEGYKQYLSLDLSSSGPGPALRIATRG